MLWRQVLGEVTGFAFPDGPSLGTVPCLPRGISCALVPWMASLTWLSPAAHSSSLPPNAVILSTSKVRHPEPFSDPRFPECPWPAYCCQLLWQGESQEKPSGSVIPLSPSLPVFSLSTFFSPYLSANQPVTKMLAPICSSTCCFLLQVFSTALLPIEHHGFSLLKNAAQRAVSVGAGS